MVSGEGFRREKLLKIHVTGIFPPSILSSLAIDSLSPSLVSVSLLQSTLRDIVKITEQINTT